MSQQHDKELSRAQAKAAYEEKQRNKYGNDRIWCAWFDGSAAPNPGTCGAGVLLRAPDGRRWEWQRKLGYGNSSEAEYQALIMALELAHPIVMADPYRSLLVLGDSRVVIDDVALDASKSAGSLRHLHQRARELIATYPELELRWLPRHRNVEADRLASVGVGGAI